MNNLKNVKKKLKPNNSLRIDHLWIITQMVLIHAVAR